MAEREALWRLAILVLVPVVAVALAPRASALAGLAEHQRTYAYNRLANLLAVSPGDICEGADKHCLQLLRPDGRAYQGAGGSLEAVSVPAQARSPYVLARRSRDAAWMVFDLDTDTIVAESANVDEVLVVWEELGLSRPEIIEAQSAHRYLEETRQSVVLRWSVQIVFMAMGALIPSLLLMLIFGGLARRLKREHHDSGSRIRLLLARIFMVPATLAGMVLAVCVAVLVAVWVVDLL